MRIAVYVRVSTPRQVQTQTIDQQLDRLQAYIAAQGWTLPADHIFRDDGYSGASLNRPGLERLRALAAAAELDRLILTAPDRLARNYVHQMLLLDELMRYGCQVEFLDRPMSADPHDQLLLQIRGAVAEYERSVITERMRRGRQMKLRAGLLLPWTRPPYGYRVDPDRPRDPAGVHLDPAEAATVQQLVARYLEDSVSLIGLAKELCAQDVPTPRGSARWNLATLRGILTNPCYTGQVYAGRMGARPPQVRRSATHPIGQPTTTRVLLPREQWIAVATIPAVITQEQFEQVQAKLAHNKQFAPRNNTVHTYLLRTLVSCGVCQAACNARTEARGYGYYVCRAKGHPVISGRDCKCAARFIPAKQLDELVWRDLCAVLSDEASITQALSRAHGGHWLPQELQARKENLRKAQVGVEHQLERLTDAYLAGVIPLAEYQRRRSDLERKVQALSQQLQQLMAQIDRQLELAALASGITDFCQRVQTGLATATFEQRRQLVELLIDRVVVANEEVEIRYVIPTSPAGEHVRFCHLRKDYFDLPPACVAQHDRPGLRECADRLGSQQIPRFATFAQTCDDQSEWLWMVKQCHWGDHHANLDQLLGSRVAQLTITLRAFAAPNRRGFALLTPVVQQLVALLPAHHEAQVC